VSPIETYKLYACPQLNYKSIHAETIGRGVIADDGDELRQTSMLSKGHKKMYDWIQQITTLVNDVCPGLKPSDMFILSSLQGAERQATHMDGVREIPKDDGVWDSCPPLSMLCAFEDDAEVCVFPGTHHYLADFCQSKIKNGHGTSQIPKPFTVKLRKGECILFRQDLAHYGCAYKKSKNLRGFLYFDHPDVIRDHNAVYMLGWDVWKMWFGKETEFERYDEAETERPAKWRKMREGDD
jgi:hypothetical protein